MLTMPKREGAAEHPVFGKQNLRVRVDHKLAVRS